MRSFMFDILQGDMTRSKVILTFTCLKMYIARSGDTSGSRTTLFNLNSSYLEKRMRLIQGNRKNNLKELCIPTGSHLHVHVYSLEFRNVKIEEVPFWSTDCPSKNDKAQKKNCYVALTRPKSENWVGRSIFFFFFTLTVSFPIFFLKFLNGENLGGMQSKRIYTSAFLSHWIQILANSSPKSDIKKKKKKKKTTLFFRILRSVGRGQHNKTFFGLIRLSASITLEIVN